MLCTPPGRHVARCHCDLVIGQLGQARMGSSETCSSIHTAPCKCQARTVQQKQEATGLPMLLSQGTRACEVSTQRHLLEQQQASHEPQTA